MELLGATAIEDKLQDGVPETIAMLLRAGIKLWVLTGDKQETAINIGLSSRMMDDRTDMRICNGDEDWLIDYLASQLQELKTQAANNRLPKDMALVIDGATLFFALQDHIKDGFVAYALYFRTVICCRVSPLQKATVVALVKERTKAVTLAIGDGANDVGMLQAANIGVGLHGEEGSQAVRASDFSIGQFRYLLKLVLVHGSWSMHRQSTLILYQFYIQILFNMMLMYFQFVNSFSILVRFLAHSSPAVANQRFRRSCTSPSCTCCTSQPLPACLSCCRLCSTGTFRYESCFRCPRRTTRTNWYAWLFFGVCALTVNRGTLV